MKKLLTLFAVSIALLMLFGCSQSPTVNNSDTTDIGTMLQRPEFVELRPQAEVQVAIMQPASMPSLDKKPTPPPPDPGGDDPNPNPAHKYAYIVGISDYEGTVNDLQYCDEDAVAMKSYLQSQGFTVVMDLDGNATADNITAGLQWLVNQAVPGDEVAFCYSGHGVKVQTYGSSIISTDLYYLTHGYVMQYFNAINCTKKTMTLDCCVIGDFHGDAEAGTMMATASTSSSSYDVPAFEHGAWTYFWLIAAEDLNKVYAEDIASYAETQMKAWAKTYHLRATPAHTDLYEGGFDI
ncbi:MAG: caspase family protein [candidate division Zixibacteria bacterium]|nr:caspase family protein [candidate division Zixibacteria bacterium]